MTANSRKLAERATELLEAPNRFIPDDFKKTRIADTGLNSTQTGELLAMTGRSETAAG